MGNNTEYKYIGTRSIRPDGVEKVTGAANYGADFSMPGMLHGKFLRSPHAHAKIKSIDTSAAEALDGVYSVATSADLPDLNAGSEDSGDGQVDFHDLSCNILARGSTRRWLKAHRFCTRPSSPKTWENSLTSLLILPLA